MTRPGQAAAHRFEKVGEHVYFRPYPEGGCNVGAVVGDDGVVLIDTPPENGAAALVEALARITPKPVRWVVETQALPEHTASEGFFAGRGATIVSSAGLERLRPSSAERQGALFVFERQMRIFTGAIEVRAMAIAHKARTSGDLVVIVPGERVVLTGDLFAPGRYPAIDQEAGGSAAGWIEGARQVVDAVPLLRSAMPQPKRPETKKSAAKAGQPPEEKSLEELVAVVPGHGAAATLADLKALVENAQKLRSEVVRAIGAGRSRDSFLGSGALVPYRGYREADAFAGELWDALARK